MMRVLLNGTDISPLVTALELDRGLDTAGAELRLDAVCAPRERYIPKLNPAWGDEVVVLNDADVLFRGRAERVQFNAAELTLRMVCLERTALLARNEWAGPMEGTPSVLASALIRAAGLVPGTLWKKSGTVRLGFSCGRSCLAGIRAAYGGDCFIEERDGAVDILQPGTRRCTLDNERLLGLTTQNSIERLVTRTEVRDSGGVLLAQAARSAWETQFGQRKQVLALAGAQHTADAQARAGICAAVRQAEAVIPGDPAVRCGALVRFEKGAFGAAGDYLIRRVRHEVRDGVFLTTLGLETAEGA